MLRMLLHIVGDIHQPLHSSSFFSQEFPYGDRGGNSYYVHYNGSVQKWHSIWDGQFGYVEDCNRPIDGNCLNMIEYYADLYTKNYPRSSMSDLLNDKDRTQWTIDSFVLSNNAYEYMVAQGASISNAWGLKTYNDVVQKQIALAGYRVADMIYDIYSKQNHFQQHRMTSAATDFLAEKLKSF